MKLTSWFGLSVLSFIFLLSFRVSAATIYISSEEASGVNETGQLLADTLDDYRKNGFNAAMNSSNTNYQIFQFSQTGNIGTAILDMTYNQINANPITTKVSLRNVTGSDLRGLLHETSFPSISDAITMQDTSPKPFSLQNAFFRNEESAGSTTSKNGILFEFGEPVIGFGVWIGDIETRTDGTGIAAEVRLFDSNGNVLTTRQIEPAVSDQSICGGSSASASSSACGNETTRFVGFSDSNKQVASMLIVVGDDDAGDDGYREHLSFMGPTMALQITNGVCNNTISGHFFTTGSLPSTGVLCTNGVIQNLIQGATGWNRSCQGINLGTTMNCSFNITTTGTTTTGTTTTGTTTTGTTTTGTTTTGTTTTGTTTTGTTTTGTTTTGTTTTGTTTTGTTTTGTTTTGTTTTGTTTTGTTTTGTTTTGTTTTGTTTTGTTTTGTTTTGTTTTGTTTTGTTTTGTTTTGTTTTGTTTTGTTTTGTTTTGTTTTGTTISTGKVTTGVIITGVNVTGNNSTGIIITGNNTTGNNTTGTQTGITNTTSNYILPIKILAPGGRYEPQPLPMHIFQTISNIKQKSKRMIQFVVEKTEQVILLQALPDTGRKIKRILEIVFSSLIGISG